MTPDERYDELDQEDAAHADVLADLGVAIREFAAARRVYEQAIAAAGAAGARMKAAALAEERALEAVRIAHGAPIATPEILDAIEAEKECDILVGRRLQGGRFSDRSYAWKCRVHHTGADGFRNEAEASRSADIHLAAGR